MTLRATIEIVPFGNEDNKSEIYRVDISNQGETKNLGFGNVYCDYSVKIFKKNLPYFIQKGEEEWELEYEEMDAFNHNRKDGALVCVGKALDWFRENYE